MLDDPRLPCSPISQAETKPACVRGIQPGWEWGRAIAVMVTELTLVVIVNCWELVPRTWKLRPGWGRGLPNDPGSEQLVGEGG